MNGTDLITLLMNNSPAITSAVSGICGALFTSIFLRKDTAVAEFEKIKAGQLKEVAVELLSSGKMTYTEYYKANNFLDVAQKADLYYSEMKREESSESYDFDWFMRFYEAVGDVSDTEIQEIWARILAGEINSPTSFSMKTIDVLRNLSKKDAELFGSICTFCMESGDHSFLPNYDEYLNMCGITYSDVMRLSELGLINNGPLIVLKVPIDNQARVFSSDDKYVLFLHTEKDETQSLDVKQYPLTIAGRELRSILEYERDEQAMIRFGRVLSTNESVNVSVNRIVKIKGGTITYNSDNLLLKS